MTRRRSSALRPRPLLAAIALCALAAVTAQTQQTGAPYDLVLAGGRVMDPASGLDAISLKQRAADTMLTLSRLTGKDREQYQSLSQRDKDRFLAHKFLSQQNKRYSRFAFEQGLGSGILARLGGGMFRDDFRALDGVGAGQVAGAVMADRDLQKALSAGNSTHTSDWDDLSEVQRDNVRKKIESQMSAADALSYQRMTSDDRNSFVQSFYLADPVAFAPGVGKSGVDKMTDFLMHPEKLKGDANAANLAAAALLMRHMTRQEKDQATRRYLKWEKDNGRPADPSLLLGQLGGMSVSDRMLDSALSFGGKSAMHMVDGFQSNRLVTAAMKKLDFITHAKDDIRRIGIPQENLLAIHDLSADERKVYDRASARQKDQMLKLKADVSEAWGDYQAGKMSAIKFDQAREAKNIAMSMIVAEVQAGGDLLSIATRARSVMSASEARALETMDDAHRKSFENLMLKRRAISKKFANRSLTAKEYYKGMRDIKKAVTNGGFGVIRLSGMERLRMDDPENSAQMNANQMAGAQNQASIDKSLARAREEEQNRNKAIEAEAKRLDDQRRRREEEQRKRDEEDPNKAR